MAVRILHWYPNFLHGGGCANAVRALAAAQARQGAEVTIAAAASSRRPLYQPLETVPGVHVHEWVPARERLVAGQHVRLAPRRESARLAGMAPDVAHVHGEFNLDNLRVARLFRCPLVISPHGACHPVVLAKSRRLAKRIFLATERALLRRHLRAYHALSPAEAEHIRAAFPGSSCYCVPQGPSTFVAEAAAPLAAAGASRDQGLTILFVGRLDVFTKGLDLLVEAFALMIGRCPGRRAQLVLAGPDWKGGRTWLEHLAATLGVSDRVRFTGALRGAQIGQLLATADIYVQLSRHEGFPLSVAEALLAHKPAVLSDAIGTMSYPEVATLPHLRVVPPKAEAAALAMAAVVADLPLLAQAALCSEKALTDFFSWDRVASLHLDRYRRLVET